MYKHTRDGYVEPEKVEEEKDEADHFIAKKMSKGSNEFKGD